MNPTLYLDFNASAPLAPGVLEALLPFLETKYFNPSSASEAARPIRSALERARREVARLVGAKQPGQITFTSGGTESIHASFHRALASTSKPPRILLSSVEHAASKGAAADWEARGAKVEFLPVDPNGQVPFATLERALQAGPVTLVSLILANNETGVCFDPTGLANLVHRHDALLHLDAVQAPGKIALKAFEWGVDWLSISGHKFGAPKGTGALYSRATTPTHPWLAGGGQEAGQRGGTENVAGIVGLGVAAQIAADQAADPAHLRTWAGFRDQLEATILGAIPVAFVHGQSAQRVPNTSFLCLPGQPAEFLLPLLEAQGLLCSAGSACDASHFAPSPVLLAMGVPEDLASSSLRLSLGPSITRADVEQAAECILRAHAWLSEGAPQKE